jgi:hypothetical protein
MIERLLEVERRIGELMLRLGSLEAVVSGLASASWSGAGGLAAGGSGIYPRVAQAHGTIGARSSSTWGTGTAYFVDDSGASALSATTDTFAVRNLLNKTIDDASWILLVPTAADRWWVVAAGDCGNLH